MPESESGREGERASTYIHFVEHHNFALDLVETMQMQMLLQLTTTTEERRDVTAIDDSAKCFRFRFLFCLCSCLSTLDVHGNRKI